jgi:hypothetical protein
MLMETRVIDVHSGTVRISCPDAFNFSTLKRHKDLLASALHQVVGKYVAIEPVLQSNADIPVKSIYTTTAASKFEKQEESVTSQTVSAAKEHPILTILKRELGAERVE